MLIVCVPIACVGVDASAWGADRPNIVVIIADDVGYGDIGAFIGGGIRGFQTPNLDRMAKEGLKLTSFYAQPFCTPTRASRIASSCRRSIRSPRRQCSRYRAAAQQDAPGVPSDSYAMASCRAA